MGLLKWFFRYKLAKGLFNAVRGRQAGGDDGEAGGDGRAARGAGRG